MFLAEARQGHDTCRCFWLKLGKDMLHVDVSIQADVMSVGYLGDGMTVIKLR